MRTPSVSSTGSRPSSAAKAKACATSLIGPGRHARLAQPDDPVVGRRRREGGLELGGQLVAVLHARRVGGEALVAGQLRAPDDRAQTAEDRVVADGDREVAVGGRERLVRGDRRVAIAHAPRHRARVEMGRGLVEQAGQRRVHERDLDVLAPAVAIAGVQGREDAVGGEEAADHVDERRADLQRPPVGLAGDRHEPAHRLQQQVVAGQRRGPLARAEGADRAVHDAGVGARDLVVAEAEAVAGARPEGLDDDVGADAQLARERHVGRVLEVERDRALVAVEAQVVGRALVDERRPPGARVVAAVGALDLDHVGPEVAEAHRAQRAGEHPREVGDEDAIERG